PASGSDPRGFGASRSTASSNDLGGLGRPKGDLTSPSSPIWEAGVSLVRNVLGFAGVSAMLTAPSPSCARALSVRSSARGRSPGRSRCDASASSRIPSPKGGGRLVGLLRVNGAFPPLLRELLQRLLHSRDRAYQAIVVRAGPVDHRHEVAMHGVKALCRALFYFRRGDPGGFASHSAYDFLDIE